MLFSSLWVHNVWLHVAFYKNLGSGYRTACGSVGTEPPVTPYLSISCNVAVTHRDRLIYQPSGYLGLSDISASAKAADFISLSRCWQNAVIFLPHPGNLLKKAQESKSRQLSCSNVSRCVFINKQARWIMEHVSAITAKTKASSLINQIN